MPSLLYVPKEHSYVAAWAAVFGHGCQECGLRLSDERERFGQTKGQS